MELVERGALGRYTGEASDHFGPRQHGTAKGTENQALTKTPKKSDSKYPQWLQMSASQLESFAEAKSGCRRRWWFASHRRLPQVWGKQFGFGTVLHSVSERFLLADRSGRDPETGEPVDLFPEGWETAEDRSGQKVTLTPREQKLVRVLVKKAIEDGILEREPGRLIEHEFKTPVAEVLNPDGTVCKVRIKGLIDVLLPGGFEDHKTTKDKRYCKSSNALRKNIQMLVYGKALLNFCEENGVEPPEVVTAAHNYFVKDFDAPLVRKVVTQIPRQDIEDFWEEVVVPAATEMVFLKRITEWEKVPGPAKTASACNHMGGCKFRPICSRSETVLQYTKRVEKLQAANGLAQVSSKKEAPVAFKSLAERLKEREAKKQRMAAKKDDAPPADEDKGVNPPKTEQAKKKEAEDAAAEEAPKAASTPAPWAQEDCGACEGSGMNTKGNPCRICVEEAPGKLQPSKFKQSTDEDGNLVWTKKGTTQKVTTTLPVEEPKSEVRDAPEATKPAPAKKKTTRKKSSKKTEETSEEAPAPLGGSFILCYGCRPTGKDVAQEIMEISEALNTFGGALASKKGAESFWHLDPFDRRDWLAQAASKIAKRLGSTVLVVPRNAGPDASHFAEALRPYAGAVFLSE